MFTNKRPPVLNQVLQAEAQNKTSGTLFKTGGRLFQSRQDHVLKQTDVFFTKVDTCFKKAGRLLRVQSCESFNNKYMIASTQITNTEIFAFIAVLVFELLSHKFLFINIKNNRNCLNVGYFLRKQQISRVSYCKIINSQNVKFSGYF